MKHLVTLATAVILLSQSSGVKAQEPHYLSYDGISVGHSDKSYFSTAGPYIFFGTEKNELFDFTMDNMFYGGISILYDTDNLVLRLIFEGDFGDQIAKSLLSFAKGHSDSYILARITLSNDEFFVCPIYFSDDGDMFVLQVSDATFSSAIEEIGTDRFNTWSTLKYLGSRLYKFDITDLELAADNSAGNFTNLCTICVGEAYGSTSMKAVLEAIAKASGDRDFITYSWELQP